MPSMQQGKQKARRGGELCRSCPCLSTVGCGRYGQRGACSQFLCEGVATRSRSSWWCVCVGGVATRPRAVGVWVPCCAPRWRDVALRVEETAGGWQRVVGWYCTHLLLMPCQAALRTPKFKVWTLNKRPCTQHPLMALKTEWLMPPWNY
jgi:hypothetical protein